MKDERDHGRARGDGGRSLRGNAGAVGGAASRARAAAPPGTEAWPGAISSTDAIFCLTSSSSSSKSDGLRSTIGAPLASRTTTSTTTAVVDVAKPDAGACAAGLDRGLRARAGAGRDGCSGHEDPRKRPGHRTTPDVRNGLASAVYLRKS